MDIRRALPADLEPVSEIYAHEAREGHATFDHEGRSMELWEEKIAGDDHFLVAEHDGLVVGYATSSPFRPKPAYVHTRETTIYVAPGHQGLGTGRQLYDALLALLVDDGVHLAVAGVAQPNDASMALHRACGFEVVGTMREVGRKHGRWIDVTWLQKVLG
ncbi:N-acetyltransferase family protein [Nocardioides KLBMP 9356]|uniref:N-acetyltransferase family protein n=1 Tax=Nocardioides potassii TaxID=2911371 RepID=A0ABS9H8E0_9ACTN|nr:GNAT family N-acetyltransferase [Nocardioides potassii]MCF6377486.1 N-acetyltransferase family protein [Nocardioides potassii]